MLHLLHYIPERRGQDFDTIEDIIPLHDLGISLKSAKPVQSVMCVPAMQELAFEQSGGQVAFSLPNLNGHQLICITF
ncbi:MAG: hypothetical protein MUO62_05265 [Anaerolineales bacterium]|nr:hypothetical protein [Anaerolineales bacterium]